MLQRRQGRPLLNNNKARRRIRTSTGRAAKAKKLRRVAGERSSVVFKAGHIPTTVCGSDIYGPPWG
eukprot:9458355-Alexandrium_andersonii.AAC.1